MSISAFRKDARSRNGVHPEAAASFNGTHVASPEVALERRLGRTAVLEEETFSHLLVRERKRSDRSNRPFILLSLTTKAGLDLQASPVGKAVVEALTAATRETDIVGWLTQPTVVGVIFPEIGIAEPARAVATMRARVHREIERRLGPGALDQFVLEFHVYPESTWNNAEPDASPVDLLLHPDLSQQGQRRRLSQWLKRALDVVFSLGLLFWVAPVLLVIAVAVRLTSPGPILFRQIRLGKMGKPFKMLKFRTMYVNSSEAVHNDFITRFIKESGHTQTPAKDQIFKLTNDPRITPVGRLLRKTSLDELPQLWNVLRGEMSLVGPRPPLPYEIVHYAPWHRRRVVEATPGITGLWQVTGRSRTTFDDMVRLDLRYARTRSIWTDLRILLRTPRAVVSGKGAC
jgi:lipopolysaccharide/colanic/teichoic acid biosynthesis glycosyltransferase